MAKSDGTRFDRFWARVAPTPYLVVVVLFTVALAGILLFFPNLVQRHDLDSLAFGITFCWTPIGIIGLVVSSFRTKDNARRAWAWLGSAIFLGLGAMLLVNGMAARGEDEGTRLLLFVLCVPLVALPLIPAVYFLVKVWRELE